MNDKVKKAIVHKKIRELVAELNTYSSKANEVDKLILFYRFNAIFLETLEKILSSSVYICKKDGLDESIVLFAPEAARLRRDSTAIYDFFMGVKRDWKKDEFAYDPAQRTPLVRRFINWLHRGR